MDDDGSNNNNNNVRAHQEQEEEEPLPLPLPLPQITIVLLTPEGQKVRSILATKPEELPLCVINDSNELMNDIAATGEFLSVIRSMSADDLSVRDAQHRQEDEQRAHQQGEQEEEEEELQPRLVLLTPEGQNVRSILAKKLEDLPQCVINEINALMNDIAAAGEFLPIVRTSIVDDIFVKDQEHHRREQQQQTRGLTTTIVDTEEWPKEEKRYETALRLFPDILLKENQGYNLIQWLAMRAQNSNYILKNISLIPLIVKLGIELQQFGDELRGGLLSPFPSGRIPLDHIICYYRNEHTTNTTDECFSVVVERLREENHLVTEDIQEHHLVVIMCTHPENSSEDRLRYLINMAPVTLSLPSTPQQGNWFPIHWAADQGDIRTFSLLVNVGMQYFPEKLAFVFCDGTTRGDSGTLYRGTPFELACDKYGQGTVTNLVIDSIQEYCFSSTTSTSDANNRETSLLIAAITDETIHRDALFILVRNDPAAALLKLQQQSLRDALYLLWRNDPAVALSNIQQQVLRVEGEGQTRSTDTNTNTHSSNDNNSKGATDTIAASMTTTTVSATTTTVSSPPTATAAPRDSLAIISFQASMDPTVSTSGTGTGTGTANNNNSHNISEEEVEEELKIVGQEEVAAVTGAIAAAATEAVTSRGVVEEEEEPQEIMDDATVVAIPESVLGSVDAAFALLTTAVLESASYDDIIPTTVDVDENQDKDELKVVRTEVAAVIAATNVVVAVTSREAVAKEEIPTIADDEDEAPGGGVEESKEEAPEEENEGAAEAPPTPLATS